MKKHTAPSIRSLRYGTLAVVIGSLAAASAAYATDGTWTKGEGGNWNNPANWAGGNVANGVGAKAVIETDGKGGNISLDGKTYTLGSLTLKSRTQWNLQYGTLILDTGSDTPPAIITSKTAEWANQYLNSTVKIEGSQGFVKRGGGKLYIVGSNTYTGVTTVNEGVLEVGNANALGASGAGNATVVNHTGGNYPQLRLNKNINLPEDISLRQYAVGTNNSNNTGLLNATKTSNTLSGVLTINRSGNSTGDFDFRIRANKASRLTLAGGVNGRTSDGARKGMTYLQTSTADEASAIHLTGVVADGALSNTGGLTLKSTGKGTTLLAAANTYSGGTLHESGILVAANTQGSATGTGHVLVKSGAKLAGNGSIAPSGSATITIESGATVAPGMLSDTGSNLGTGEKLTFDLSQSSGTVTFAAGADLHIDISQGSGADSLVFKGTSTDGQVAFNGNAVNFAIYGPSTLKDGVYTIVSFDKPNAYTGELVLGEGLQGNNARLIHNADGIQLQIGGAQ